MTQTDWDDPDARVLCAELRMASGTPVYAERSNALFLVFNAGEADATVRLPVPPAGKTWTHRMSTTTAWFGAQPLGGMLSVQGPSVAVCALEVQDG